MKQAKIAPVIVERDGIAEVVLLSTKAYNQLIAANTKTNFQKRFEDLHAQIRVELAGRTLSDPAEVIRQGGKNAMNNSSRICIDAGFVRRRMLQPDDKAVKNLWQSWVKEPR